MCNVRVACPPQLQAYHFRLICLVGPGFSLDKQSLIVAILAATATDFIRPVAIGARDGTQGMQNPLSIGHSEVAYPRRYSHCHCDYHSSLLHDEYLPDSSVRCSFRSLSLLVINRSRVQQ